MSNPTERDTRAMTAWLHNAGFGTIERWAEEQDYEYSDCCGWVDDNHAPVDPWERLWNYWQDPL